MHLLRSCCHNKSSAQAKGARSQEKLYELKLFDPKQTREKAVGRFGVNSDTCQAMLSIFFARWLRIFFEMPKI